MNGCVYKTADGQCEKFSDKTRNTMSWCVGDEPCEARTPTNADRIRGMSDEELADFLETVNMCECGFAMGVSPCRKAGTDGCPCWLDWLKSPVKQEADE